MMFCMYHEVFHFIFDIQMNSIWEESIIGFLIFILYEDAIEQKKKFYAFIIIYHLLIYVYFDTVVYICKKIK